VPRLGAGFELVAVAEVLGQVLGQVTDAPPGVPGPAQRHADAGISGDPVWPWVFQFDAPTVASYRAVATSRLGLAKMATAAFDMANGLARSPKQAAVVTTERARAIAADGHLDRACALALAAYDVGCQYDSERVRQAARDFRASLGPRAPRQVTADLDERLHSAYTSRAT